MEETGLNWPTQSWISSPKFLTTPIPPLLCDFAAPPHQRWRTFLLTLDHGLVMWFALAKGMLTDLMQAKLNMSLTGLVLLHLVLTIGSCFRLHLWAQNEHTCSWLSPQLTTKAKLNQSNMFSTAIQLSPAYIRQLPVGPVCLKVWFLGMVCYTEWLWQQLIQDRTLWHPGILTILSWMNLRNDMCRKEFLAPLLKQVINPK